MGKFVATWTSIEISILRDVFPGGEWPSILAAIPGHTRSGINQYARLAGLSRKLNKREHWTPAEISILWRLWPKADAAVIEAALPGRGSMSSIAKKASLLGVRRIGFATRTNKRFVHPFIRQLRVERERLKLTRVMVGKKSGYHENQILAWELGKAKPDLRSFLDLAEALGFELVLRKKMIGDVIPFPDRSRLMAGR